MQKGFSTLLGLLLVLAIGVGVYVYRQTETFNQTDTVILNEQKNSEEVKTSNAKIVNKEPVIENKANYSLSDETIKKIFERGTFIEIKGEFVKSGMGFSEMTRGDIDSDGYEDVLYIATSCGASCGSSLGAIINQKDGSGKDIVINSEKYIRPSGADQTGITDMQINNGIISITANGFIGEEDWDKSVIKNFRVEGGELVEII